MPQIELVPTVARLFPKTRLALQEPPVSHRSKDFSEIFLSARQRLCRLSGERFDAVFACGSGTWANDLMVWSFAPTGKSVLVLTNGEFGNRLAAQVRACRPDAGVFDFGFGKKISEPELTVLLEKIPPVDLIFCVANETSWGGTTDLAMLNRVAAQRGIKICLDAMSAFAFTPEIFTFPQIIAITASSGKGLASIPGIALLFFDRNQRIADTSRPETLRLEPYIAAAGNNTPRNTLSSVLLKTFHAACGEIIDMGSENYRQRLTQIKKRIIRLAQKSGVRTFPQSDSPMITAFYKDGNAERFLENLRKQGFSAYTQPAYLSTRNLFEIAVMGDFRPTDFPQD